MSVVDLLNNSVSVEDTALLEKNKLVGYLFNLKKIYFVFNQLTNIVRYGLPVHQIPKY